MHYEEKKFPEALEYYQQVIYQFSSSIQANLSKKQIDNIKESLNKSSNEKIVDVPVVLTTAPFLEGYEIIETIEIVTAECCFGMNLFLDFFTSMTDIIGGRSETAQKKLRDARKMCLHELKREAFDVGADAVISVDLDYSEFSGKGKSMLFLIASGTAVKIKKRES